MREDVAVLWGGASDIGKNASPDDLKFQTLCKTGGIPMF